MFNICSGNSNFIVVETRKHLTALLFGQIVDWYVRKYKMAHLNAKTLEQVHLKENELRISARYMSYLR